MRATLSPATFFGLLAHELRLSWRTRDTLKKWQWSLGLAIFAGFWALGAVVAHNFRNVPIHPSPGSAAIVLMGSLALLSFGLSQAMVESYQALDRSGDLDLLLSAPVAQRFVLGAKLSRIVVTVALSQAGIFLPILIPILILGHPQLWGAVALMSVIAVISSCLGLGASIAIARTFNPGVTRTVIQVVAAVSGGAVVIGTQVAQFFSDEGKSSGYLVFNAWFRDHQVGERGLSGLIVQAAFGNVFGAIMLVAAALSVFGLTSWGLQKSFLIGFQRAGMRVAGAREPRGGIRSLFSSSLNQSVLVKEVKLLQRDPALVFNLALRMIYMVPLMLMLFRKAGSAYILPMTGGFGVFLLTQLASNIATLTISGEDTPDLLRVAPTGTASIGKAKVIASLAMISPLMVVFLIGISLRSWLAALGVLIVAITGSAGAAYVQLRLEKPMQRKRFGRANARGSLIGALINLALSVVFCILAGWAVWELAKIG